MALDERLRRELEEAGRPADPSGVYEELIRLRERRRLVHKVEAGVLAVVVVLGSIGGVYALTRIFGAPPRRRRSRHRPMRTVGSCFRSPSKVKASR